MFAEPGHLNHSSGWTVASPSCRNSVTCLACLLEVLNNPALSHVHKQMSLDTLKLLVSQSDVALQLLAAHDDMVFHIIDLITVIVSLVHKLPDEKVCAVVMRKFQEAVENMAYEQNIHFFLLAFGQLCEMSATYSQMLICTQLNSVDRLLSCRDYIEVDTSSALVCLLTHVMKALSLSPLQGSPETDRYLWSMMVNLVYWLNTADNHRLQACCLCLLAECVQHQEITLGLLLVGQNSEQGHSLLMGLKRILVTKDEGLVFAGTQCLTGVLDSLTGTQHIQEVFDTDLAEFVFELLHTSDATKLDQPESMPLFVNQSWVKLCHLLNSCLHHNKLSVFLTALQATRAFLRTKHQQSPVDVSAVAKLVRTATSQAHHYIQTLVEQAQEMHLFHIITIMSDIALANIGLLTSEAVLCGNMMEQIHQLETAVRDVCSKLVLPCVLEHWHYLSDSSRIEKFLACLDVHLSPGQQEQQAAVRQLVATGQQEQQAAVRQLVATGQQEQQAAVRQLVATGQPCRILALSQAGSTDDTKRLIGHIVAGIFLQLARCQRPSLELHEEMLISGFSQLNWQDVQPGPRVSDMVSSKDEVVAWFCLTYFSYLMGYRMWQLADVETILEKILERFPALLSFGVVVTRGFVYLQAICQTSSTCLQSIRCDETEHSLMTFLSKSAVDTWFTEDPAVFKWSLLTERRADTVGVKLIEYWLLHLAAPAHSCGLQISSLPSEQTELLHQLQHNYLFLRCLVVLLGSASVAGLARDVLLHCVSTSPGNDEALGPGSVWEQLFLEVSRRFQALFVHTQVNAVKLAGKPDVSGISLTWTLKYLACVTSIMSQQDARTVLPAVVKEDQLLDILQVAMCSSDTSTSVPALHLCAWLATTEHQCLPSRPLVVTCEFLLSSLASCRHATSLPVLKLLKAALSSMKHCAPLVGRCVQFVKQQRNFTSSKMFSTREFKQVYLYLQEIVVKEDVTLRSEAVECMKVLFHTDTGIGDYGHTQAWNGLMLESVITTRIQSGLTNTELDLCLLFLADMETLWTRNAINGFLLALLNSNLNTCQLERAAAVVGQVRQLPGFVDKEALALTDKYFIEHTARGD